jgi:hypothetical protein
MSQVNRRSAQAVVDLEEDERKWLEARIREYNDLLDYLREH